MKKVFFTFLMFLLAMALHAQSLDCARFKNGKFQITVNGHTTVIERSGPHQTEYFVGLADSAKMTFNVNWVDDCTYTLMPTDESYKKYPTLPKNGVLTVKITNTTPNSYTQSSTFNFMDKTFVSEVVKIE